MTLDSIRSDCLFDLRDNSDQNSTSFTMTEVSFTRSFLQSVDKKPIRLPYDYVADPVTTRLPVPVSLSASRWNEIQSLAQHIVLSKICFCKLRAIC